MTILLDMDGVMVNFLDAFLAMLDSKVKQEEITQWDFCAQLGLTEKQFWDKIEFAGAGFWATLPKYPWSDELFKALGDYDITYLTNPGNSEAALCGKLRWVRKYHGENQSVIFSREKELLAGCGNILIDDREDTCKAFERFGGKAILFPQPWNSNRKFTSDRVGYVMAML